MVPFVARSPQTEEYLAEPVPIDGRFSDGLLHLAVITTALVVEIRSMELHQSARPSDADLVFLHYLADHFLFYLGL
ncbi:MAG: hypothetical protein CW336_07155 [Bacteroidetes bacterium]|nr:hypothetical protein [Bacteroidota bacterium]